MKFPMRFTLVFLLALWTGSGLYASQIVGGDEVNIESSEENVYAAGGTVTVNGKIDGDLFAAAGEITLRDSLLEDGMLTAGTITLNAPVAGDLRIGAGNITINSSVGGDLVIGGGNIQIAEDAVIMGDLIIGGGSVHVYGTVHGKVELAAGSLRFFGHARDFFKASVGDLYFDGTVDGESKISAGKIKLGDNARFNGNVRYWRDGGEMDFGDALASGATATFDTALKASQDDFSWQYLGLGVLLFWLIRLIAAAVMIVLLVLLLHRSFSRAAIAHPGSYIGKFGWGILYAIGAPILAGILIVTIIGSIAGLTVLGVWGLSIMLAHILASLVLAYELEQRSDESWSKGKALLIAIALYAGIKIICLIPILGWLFALVIAAYGFGHLLIALFRKDKPEVVTETEMV